eukprot:TRINITY_DN1944_c0_g1_i1.p1 TRINITY_DN1944_c0_g1~~TRINITY_DN1944_c0_g1_i1.p1  ORF type:complete len:104 (-),score=0.53 TRINITY_DN1944_c0_g1_i1:11-322(-)
MQVLTQGCPGSGVLLRRGVRDGDRTGQPSCPEGHCWTAWLGLLLKNIQFLTWTVTCIKYYNSPQFFSFFLFFFFFLLGGGLVLGDIHACVVCIRIYIYICVCV